MLCLQPGWLPATVGITLFTGAITSYVIAVIKQDVTPYVPLISESAGYMPQSGIFAILLTMSATASFFTIYIRYSLVKELTPHHPKVVQHINTISAIVGYLSSVGLLLIASYPITTIEIAHDIGAYTTFLCGVGYSFLQTYITFKLYPEFNGRFICYMRLAISICSFLSMLILIIFYIMGRAKWDSGLHSHNRDKRMPGEKGFQELLISSIAEWCLSIFFIFFFYSFIREFRKGYVHLTSRLLVRHFDEDVSLRMTWRDEHRPILVS